MNRVSKQKRAQRKRPTCEYLLRRIEELTGIVNSLVLALPSTGDDRKDLDGWLPMNSAPHDGTRVLLLVTIGNSAPTVQVGTRASIAGAAWVLEGIGIYSAFKFHGWQPLPAVPKHYEQGAPESAASEWRPISELPCGTSARLRNGDHYTYGGYGPYGGFVDGGGNPLTWHPTEWQPLYAS